MRWCRIGGNVLAIQWRHNANDSTNDGVWNRKVINQPGVIHDYKRHMGVVDMSDQLINSHNVLQKT
jgi:hypothetical protein